MAGSVGISKIGLTKIISKGSRPGYVFYRKPDPATEVGDQRTGVRQPRNAPCACGSGRRYKACCGGPPAVR